MDFQALHATRSPERSDLKHSGSMAAQGLRFGAFILLQCLQHVSSIRVGMRLHVPVSGCSAAKQIERPFDPFFLPD